MEGGGDWDEGEMGEANDMEGLGDESNGVQGQYAADDYAEDNASFQDEEA